jgi:peptidoglycan hydrolase-like protein with peptidoglycan-binding domain
MKKALSMALAGVLIAGSALAQGMSRQQESSGQSGQIQDQPYSMQQNRQMQRQGGLSATQQRQQSAMADKTTVREVQQKLKQQGYNVNVDGVMGPNTRTALRQFQQDQGISGNGQIDQQTLAALGVEGGAQQAQTPSGAGRMQPQQQQQQRGGTQGGGMDSGQ